MSEQPKTITDVFKPEINNLVGILNIRGNNPNAEAIILQEINFLEQIAMSKPIILQCDPMSVILSVKSAINKNLSLDPSAGLVYVKTRNQNIAKYGQPDKWITVLEIQETVNGLISYNRQLGRIFDVERPKISKDTTGKVIAVSVRILQQSYGQPRWETYDYDESDFLRWRTYSHKERAKGYKPNKGMEVPNIETLNYANALYTSWKEGIDPEFARAKAIRHSLKKLGANNNEIKGMRIVDQNEPVIDINIARAEAEEDNAHDYTQHEEVDSHIHETHEQQEQKQEDDFNANDL